jgi:hypothetical protein
MEADVEYRQVGNTELWASEIGFGCGGNAGLMVRGSPGEQQRVVARAVSVLEGPWTACSGCCGMAKLGTWGLFAGVTIAIRFGNCSTPACFT